MGESELPRMLGVYEEETNRQGMHVLLLRGSPEMVLWGLYSHGSPPERLRLVQGPHSGS